MKSGMIACAMMVSATTSPFRKKTEAQAFGPPFCVLRNLSIRSQLPPSICFFQLTFSQGDPNASIPTIQPVLMRPMFAAHVPSTSITFVSNASLKSGTIDKYKLNKRVEAVKNCRKIGKKDMKYNDVMPSKSFFPLRFLS